MSTSQSTIDYILDQLQSAGNVGARKMFGEYALYCDGKVVGLVCDDTLFVKITEEGKEFVGKKYKEGFAYKGARASLRIDADSIEDHEWLSALIRITCQSLPLPKPKRKPKSKKHKF
jgi:TfoX/Sxy family transcriptional regulator of competence genes